MGKKRSLRPPSPLEMGGNQVSAPKLISRPSVDEGLFQSKEVIQWCPATGDKRPYEGVDEIVLFQ
jgi:hypothetical protein